MVQTTEGNEEVRYVNVEFQRLNASLVEQYVWDHELPACYFVDKTLNTLPPSSPLLVSKRLALVHGIPRPGGFYPGLYTTYISRTM